MKRFLAALAFCAALAIPAMAADTPFMYTEGYSTTTKTGVEVISGGISTKKSTSSTADRTFNVDAQTGNVTSSGTVNGRNIAQDGAKLDAVAISTGTEAAARAQADYELGQSTAAEASARAAADTAIGLSTASLRTDLTAETTNRLALQYSTWTAVAGYGITKTGAGSITLAVDTDTLHIPAANIYPGMLPLGVTPQALAPGAYNDIHVSTADVALTLAGQGASSFALRAEVSASTASLQSQINDLAVVSSTGAVEFGNAAAWNAGTLVNIDTTTYPGSMAMGLTPGDAGKSYTAWRPSGTNGFFNWKMHGNSNLSKIYGAGYTSGVKYSSDYGYTWSTLHNIGGDAGCRGVAFSLDCSTLTAVYSVYASTWGYLLTSSDGGQNWTQRDATRHWYSVAMSTNGVYQLGCVYNPASSYFYTSNDFGVNWTEHTEQATRWYECAMSQDGRVQVVVGGIAPTPPDHWYVMVSTDFGQTWATAWDTTSTTFSSVDVSVDGSTITVGGSDLYKSTNYGANWTTINSDNIEDVDISPNGQNIVICYNNGSYSKLKISQDSGSTWQTAGWNASLHRAVAMSDDGTQMVSNEWVNGRFYTLCNSSASWTSPITYSGPYCYQWQNFESVFSSNTECDIKWYMRSGASTEAVTAAAWSAIAPGDIKQQAAVPYVQFASSFTYNGSSAGSAMPIISSMTIAYDNTQFFRKDDGININYLIATGTPSATTFLRGDAAWAEIEYAATAGTAAAVSATGTPSASTFLRGDYSWAETGTSAVVISTFAINAIAIGGDVLISSAAFSNVPGDTYNIEWSTSYVTGLMVKVVTPSTVGSTYFKVAYSSSTGTTRTWAYASDTIEVSTNSCTSGWYTVNIVLPPGTVIALHTTGIPASGTLPTNWCLVVRYYKEN